MRRSVVLLLPAAAMVSSARAVVVPTAPSAVAISTEKHPSASFQAEDAYCQSAACKQVQVSLTAQSALQRATGTTALSGATGVAAGATVGTLGARVGARALVGLAYGCWWAARWRRAKLHSPAADFNTTLTPLTLSACILTETISYHLGDLSLIIKRLHGTIRTSRTMMDRLVSTQREKFNLVIFQKPEQENPMKMWHGNSTTAWDVVSSRERASRYCVILLAITIAGGATLLLSSCGLYLEHHYRNLTAQEAKTESDGSLCNAYAGFKNAGQYQSVLFQEIANRKLSCSEELALEVSDCSQLRLSNVQVGSDAVYATVINYSRDIKRFTITGPSGTSNDFRLSPGSSGNFGVVASNGLVSTLSQGASVGFGACYSTRYLD